MQARFAPSTPVDVRVIVAGGSQGFASWVRGYFVTADEGETVLVEERTGIFAGVPRRYDRADVRPAELAPGKFVRVRHTSPEDDLGGRCGKVMRLATQDHVVVDLGAWRVTVPARRVEVLP